MAQRLRCDVCNVSIPPHQHFVVRIDVFFNPDIPEITQDELDEMDSEAEKQKLMKELEKLSPEEAQDQVHRRFEYKICTKCQRKFLINPLGLPRTKGKDHN